MISRGSTMATSTQADPALAAALRRLRGEHGLTQEDLAFKANITVSALSRIERGASNPVWTSIHTLLTALDTDLHGLATVIEEHEETIPRV